MSNGELSNLKRGAGAAFGHESDQNFAKSKRKRSKAPKAEQKASHDTAIVQPESTHADVRHEPAVTQDPPETHRNGKRTRHKRSKISKPRQQPGQDLEMAPLESSLPDLPNRPTLAQQPSNSAQKLSNTGIPTAAKRGIQSRVPDERKLSKKGPRSKQRTSASGWTITAAEGGRFGNHNPILVQSDRSVFSHLIFDHHTNLFPFTQLSDTCRPYTNPCLFNHNIVTAAVPTSNGT